MDQWEFTAIAIALILHLMFLHFPSETRFFLAVKNIDFRKERLQKLLSTTQRIVDKSRKSHISGNQVFVILKLMDILHLSFAVN